MRAMVLKELGKPLILTDTPIPKIKNLHVLIKIETCGVCRTDLHIVDGELPPPRLPLIPGHQIVGKIVECGPQSTHFKKGDRVGVAWLGKTCGHCHYCMDEKENLCDSAQFTGYQINGGFAEYCTAHQDFIFPIPAKIPAEQAAPLLCAGFIGYRALRMAEDAERIGLYGFGASAHIIAQVAVSQNRKVYAFTKPGDGATQKFAKSLGCVWAGDSDQLPPNQLDAAIIFAPVGSLVPQALKAIVKGGTVVCAGIHMSDIPSFPYSLLWEERVLRSVANLTRQDGREFLEIASKIPIKTHITAYPLEKANAALEALRKGLHDGAIVITVDGTS